MTSVNRQVSRGGLFFQYRKISRHFGKNGYLPIMRRGRPSISQKTEHLYNNTDYFNNGQNGPGAGSWVLGFPLLHNASREVYK